MRILFRNYEQAGRGIRRDEPKKKGLKRFWEIITIEYRELIKLNLYFLFSCLGIITIPAAVVAMHGITMMMVRDIPRFTIPDYVRIFRREFKRATGMVLLLVAALLITFYGAYFYWGMTETNGIFWVPAIILCAVFFELIVMSFYAFPMIACVDLKWKEIIKNSFLLSLLGLRSTVPALLILMVLYFIMMSLFPVSLILMLLCFFSLCALITCFAVYRPLNDYVFLTKDDLGDARPQEQPADESNEPDELDAPDEVDEQLPAEASKEE